MVPKTILVTGAAGFVGTHLLDALHEPRWSDAQILATTKTAATLPDRRGIAALDTTDFTAVDSAIKAAQPSHIVHLAALPTIAGASADYGAAWQLNVLATLNIARSILAYAPNCTLIFAGSAEVYGSTAKSGAPLAETALLSPMNEYAATKAAADLALGALAANGLKVIRFRPFNHIGPGQTDKFVVPAFASQIARIEAGQQAPTIHVGNLDAQRDFLDVRDVVDAYLLAVERSDDVPSGTILNIASGTPRSVRELLDRLLSFTDRDIAIEADPTRQRPNDIPVYVGDASRARALLGWAPRRQIDDTLLEVLAYWRQLTRG